MRKKNSNAGRLLIGAFYTFLVLGVLAIIAGCSRSIPPTMATSTSPVHPGVRGTIPAYGINCQYYFLGLIPVTPSCNSQEALDEAKESADVDVLTDVTVDQSAAYYILFSNNCVRVRGKGVPRGTAGLLPGGLG